MTFKEIRIRSRSMPYNEIVSNHIRHITSGDYKGALFYSCMMWLQAFNRGYDFRKIEYWMNAFLSYKLYKNYT